MNERIKIVFLGTDEISIATLKSFLDKNEYFSIILVITTNEQKVGRNHSTLVSSPIFNFCKENNLKVIQTTSINKDINLIIDLEFDFLITCSFGQILGEAILKLPKKASINIHASILPKGRGGAPIHWAIINGEIVSGISIMEMTKEMDAGDVYIQHLVEISEDDTYDSLYKKLSILSTKNTANDVLLIHKQKLAKKPQDINKVSKWFNLKTNDSKINWNTTSIDIFNRIRGLDSKPGAFSIINKKIIKLFKPKIISNKNLVNIKPGTIIDLSKKGIEIATKNGVINIQEITIEGKKRSLIEKIINGKLPFMVGDCFE